MCGHIVCGPLMGFDLDDDRAPSTKSVNCLIARSAELSKTYGIRVANQYDFGLTPDPGEGDSSVEKERR